MTEIGYTLALSLVLAGAALWFIGTALIETENAIARRVRDRIAAMRAALNTPALCVGCGKTRRTGSMRWTWWGAYLCRECVTTKKEE